MNIKPILAILGMGADYGGMMRDHEARNRAYCDRHGYALVTEDKVLDPSVSNFWNKIVFIRRLLAEGHPFIAYMDADTLIKDLSRDFREAVPAWAWIGMTVYLDEWPRANFCWNAGVMYLRNTPEASRFFEAVWAARGKYDDSIGWGDQTAINHLMLDGEWQQGLVSLGGDWNSSWRDWRTASDPQGAIVLAWHGGAPGPERRLAMLKAGEDNPY